MNKGIPNISIEEFNYHLPDDRIAKYPLEERDLSKLLVYDKGVVAHTDFKKLPGSIPENSALVFNNSKVIYARLHFKKQSGANIEIFCLEPVMPADHQLNLQETRRVCWKCLIGNKKKWKSGTLTLTIRINKKDVTLAANMVESTPDPVVEFEWDKDVTFAEILEEAGKIPIPPYLMREAQELDHERYQTIYSRVKGSVAAPTAGLHFTSRVIHNIKQKGVKTCEFTLHVGAGTFKPVQTRDISSHSMHGETFIVSLGQLKFLQKNIGKIYAVGTTSTRLLESLYYIGLKCMNKDYDNLFVVEQWGPYLGENGFSFEKCLEALVRYFNDHKINEIVAKTSIIIVPGYKFKVVKGLITNFHQPKSTLLLLIAAFIGEDWKKVYEYALDNGFRFLSYGDSSLLLP